MCFIIGVPTNPPLLNRIERQNRSRVLLALLTGIALLVAMPCSGPPGWS